MLKTTLIAVVMLGCLFADAPGRPAPPAPAQPDRPFKLGDRDEPDLDQIHVLTKSFLVGMRRHHGDANANALRNYFDPRYLKKHNLTDRDLPAELTAVVGIHTYQVADDNRTVLCLVDTKEGGQTVKEAIVLKVTVHERTLYLEPAKAPDPKTGRFTPWILRTKL
jgi:hypothetical protein